MDFYLFAVAIAACFIYCGVLLYKVLTCGNAAVIVPIVMLIAISCRAALSLAT